MARSKVLGTLRPIGGGDPIPLEEMVLVVGRRPSCDICLDFENVSGKHCELKFAHGLWHVRDLGSRNGTTLNGLKLHNEQSVLPDVEIGIATHFYTIDYEPAGPASVTGAKQLLDDDMVEEARPRKSLLEMAGFQDENARKSYRPARPPAEIERMKAHEGGFDDPLPNDIPPAPAPAVDASDDDFFNMIADDLKK